MRRRCVAGAAALAVAAGAAAAQEAPRSGPTLGLPIDSYGFLGLIDTPAAVPMPDGTFAFTATVMPGTWRTMLAFQITPRLTGSFRYARIDRPRLNDRLFDRSFDLQFQLLHERPGHPGLAIGLRDFIGTGEYSSEYLVATSHITPALRVSGGIGWGRMASAGGFRNPLGLLDSRFDTRPTGFTGTGGRLELDRFFRGRAALFGGIEYQATDRLRLMVEYSGDAYLNEAAPGGSWRRRTPLNVGATYAVSQRTSLTAFVLHGDAVGLTATIALHPDRPVRTLQPPAPVPVAVRPAPETLPQGWTEDWVAVPAAQELIRTELARRLDAQGMRLIGLELTAHRAVVRYANRRHRDPAMAVGRTARVLTEVMPNSVEEFVLVGTAAGIPIGAVTLRRSDVERLEHAPDGTEALLARAAVTDGFGAGSGASLLMPHPPEVPRFGWSLLPYLQPSIMDPTSPLRLDVGLRASASYALASNLVVSGAVTQRIGGNVAGGLLGPPSCTATRCYEPVRTEAPLYSSSRPVLQRMTIEHFSRPGPDLYGRISVGLLERMFGGISAELLWKPVDSRLAIGAEVNRVRRRSPGSFAGFTDYEVTTGHLSAYYDFENGFVAGVDVGRYLAGDVGATLRLEREFASGWRIGAFATLTDMPFEAFGEGSFDKGISLTIPISWFDGRPSRLASSQTIRSLSRDGGARLSVANRLYPMVRELHRQRLDDSWGTVWQ